MEYAEKTRLGYKRVSDNEAGYVIMTRNEYTALREDAEQEIEELKKEYEEKIRDQSDDLIQQKVDEVKDAEAAGEKKYKKACAKIDELNALCADLIDEKNYYKNEAERNACKNFNYNRISLETANAANGQNKRHGLGYVILSTSQFQEHLPDYNYNNATVEVWKTRLRTHYDASLPLDLIMTDIRRELLYKVLGRMGIEVLQTPDKNGEYDIKREFINETERIMNCVYRVSYTANLREGVWELDLFHNLPINIPQELRPKYKTTNTNVTRNKVL